MCWSQLILTQVDIVFQFCLQGCHIGSLTWAMVGVFTSHKTENCYKEGIFFFTSEDLFNIYQHTDDWKTRDRGKNGAGRSLTLSPPPTSFKGSCPCALARRRRLLLQSKEVPMEYRLGQGKVSFLSTQANFFVNNISVWWLPAVRMHAIQLRSEEGQIIYC